METNEKLNHSLHDTTTLANGAFFLKQGSPCTKIGKIVKGVLRAYIHDQEGLEVTTHFYQEGDMIIASFIPNVNITVTIQALTDVEISVANFSEIMSFVNKDKDITEVINREFEKLNNQLHARVVSLLNLDSTAKYKVFMDEYPGLLNRIPHYYIAQYLGITPTQLSRVRKHLADES